MQPMLAQDLLDLVEARARRRAHADPVRLAQRRRGRDLDRNAGNLGAAFELDAGGDRWRSVARGQEIAHAATHLRIVASSFAARKPASSAPACSTVRATPKSAS